MDESSYISWFTWYLWKFLLQLENAKWLAASPIAKGITALTNNQQSKALNINFKTKNPNDNGQKLILNIFSTHVSFIVELYCCWVSIEHMGAAAGD